ncbi:hypothetical protein L208DRAFT_1353082 [Tricholoma matsutake]|nr:hypothetical protein L208DRAFT_1353082 [Tricholoma matsutake 945]
MQNWGQSAFEHTYRKVFNVPDDEDLDGPSEEEEEELEDDEDGDEEDQLIDTENDDDELDVPVGTPRKKHVEFSIPFEVPYKNATRDLTGITSSTHFSQFLVAAASKMNVSTLHLTQLGYTPSYKPKNPKPVPKMLKDEESWEILLDDVSDYIEGCKSKNRGKGVVKALHSSPD